MVSIFSIFASNLNDSWIATTAMSFLLYSAARLPSWSDARTAGL